jgi:serine/threonine protein kinase
VSSTEPSVYLFSLFLAVRELPEERWEPELDARCPDAELKQQVRKMLSDQRGARQHELSAGMTLNARYVLEVRLGEGASATVWSAHDSKLQRKAALKIFNRGCSDQFDLDRALQEARHASDIKDEHVVRIRDVAWCEHTGLPYIDMEPCADFANGQWVYGQSMAATEPTDQAELLRWLIEAARGVHAAHERGVFHRDLKPHNIVIRPNRSAVVTDFGLAVHAGRPAALLAPASGANALAIGSGAHPSLAASHGFAGTPSYMAPEQVELMLEGRRSASSHADHDHEYLRLVRADVYALGAVLYHMLAGEAPYRVRPDASNPVLDVLTQVRQGAPASLRSRARVRDGVLPVSLRLERIVCKAMARDASARYPNAALFADDLRCYLERRPTSIERGNYLARTRLWLGTHWKTSLAVAAGVAILLINQRVTQQLDGIAQKVEAVRLQAGPSDSPTPPIARSTRSLVPEPAPAVVGPADSQDDPPVRERRAASARSRPTARQPAGRSLQSPPVLRASRVTQATVEAEGGETAALAGARTAETESSRALPAPPQAKDKPGPVVDVAQEFLQRALRDPGRLTRIDFKSRPAAAYCLVDPQSNRIHECLRRPALSGEVLATLNKAHKRSGSERFWRVDAQRSTVEACRTVKPAGSFIRRLLCQQLKVEDLPFPPPPPPPSPITPLRSGEIEVARTW